MIKKHLEGGTLREVMVEEIKRVMHKHQDHPQSVLMSACELGITPKTLRQWKGPMEKGGWKELQGYGGMEALMKCGAVKPVKKPAKKTPAKKTPTKKTVKASPVASRG